MCDRTTKKMDYVCFQFHEKIQTRLVYKEFWSTKMYTVSVNSIKFRAHLVM
jgi:hypothetical protein